MIWIRMTVFCLSIASSFAAPANNELLDKDTKKKVTYVIDMESSKLLRLSNYYVNTEATVNDIAINSVSEEKKVEPLSPVYAQQPNEHQLQPASHEGSSVQISGITLGADTRHPAQPVAPATTENTPFKPPRAGGMFARLIDDIFQIPINVLQNGARLITSPFTSRPKSPEVVAHVS
ncbi:unnamed protein product [Acanthoscelides obtectus]|uniref:Uncharacterized protein n=1 Tax=Acanthoscelides obtectus TaxID=200917 RepID=A0A9P0ME07_ACAOB|nr:unnamed protein product [Acanthoscelides obtectus]CAK1646250.1 hypothetical protein AOBTE_LOCUS14531 [Acanthoscelides obtectus]